MVTRFLSDLECIAGRKGGLLYALLLIAQVIRTDSNWWGGLFCCPCEVSLRKNGMHQFLRTVLHRGESAIAFMGIALVVVLMLTTVGAAYVGMQQLRDRVDFARREQIRTVGEILGQTAESMLASDDLSSLRRLVINTHRSYKLSECRVTLADGRIVADAEPTRIGVAVLPERWPTAPMAAAPELEITDAIRDARPLNVPGRGTAWLQLKAPPSPPLSWDLQSGAALCGAAGLASMFIVYRRTRQRVSSLGLIRDSLLSVAREGSCRDSLEIRSHACPEVDAWNRLLKEREELQQLAIVERGKGQFTERRSGRDDLDRAYDALSVGMLIVDETGRVRSANGAAAVLLTVKREQMVGSMLVSAVPSGTVQEWLTGAITACIAQRSSMESEHSIGQAILRFRLRPPRREETPGALIMIEDVTQQRTADAARNSFIAQATHELRTPLTNMRLYLETAIDGRESDPAVVARTLNVLNQETKRMERMVGDMLSVSEIEAGRIRIQRDDVQLDKLLSDLEMDFVLQAKEKRIKLEFQLPPKLPVIQADRDKTALVLNNLIGNALKYTPDGGSVSVVVKAGTSNVEVEVVDTGIGVNEDEQELIFQKFYRAKDPRVTAIIGSGLGLALARDVARYHGGDVTLDSQLDHGSTFKLTLPIVARAV